MDNMLYIVAGLVIILLIAVLIMRRQKSQPAARSINNVSKTEAERAPGDYDTALASSASGATKFDSLTVAERFIDQQRYDKAIEALERGLIQKPHDDKLSLNLLNVYAITTQPDNFYRTYDAICTHSEAATIAQAGELKALFDQEYSQTTQISARSDVNSGDDFHGTNAEGHDALDFDVASVQDETQNPPQNTSYSGFQETVSSADSNPADSDLLSSASLDSATAVDDSAVAGNDKADGIFDLTLDDLESDTLDDTVNSDADNTALKSHSLQSNDSLTLDNKPNTDAFSPDNLTLDNSTSTTKPDDSFEKVNNISEDFTLDFDEPTATDSLDNAAVELEQTNNQANVNLEDDFVLDFDDLAADSSPNSDTDLAANTGTDTFSDFSFEDDAEVAADSTSFDFDLDFDNDDQSSAVEPSLSLNTFNVDDVDNVEALDAPAVEEDLAPMSASDSANAVSADSDSFDLGLTEAQPSQAEQSATETNTDSSLLFDDDTPIDDDDFIIEDSAATIATPVVTDSKTDDADFASKFSADFDFVNDLDNHQITLDLAAKYLELGEYDSAKRLLSEVMAQGSNEQQTQAQALLERTV